MKEIAVLFGAHRNLVGTLCIPTNMAVHKTAFVLTGAGVIHRIGPHRINVKLARRLAQLGFASIRFDLSGQGDSQHASSNLDFAQQAISDIKAAMDHVARTLDIHRFAMLGICSGADNALASAQADPRLNNLFLIDGYHYPTDKTSKIRRQRRLQGPIVKAIAPWLMRKLKQLRATGTASTPTEIPNGRPFPEKEIYTHTLQTLTERGAQIYLLFSASLLSTYNYQEQFTQAFAGQPFVDKIQAQHCPHIDHTVTPLAAQHQLLERVVTWAHQVLI
jgi:pimeloyl-ACP methyl ester carboxylesterase